MSELYYGLDESMFTTHTEALDLLWHSLRSSLGFSLYGNRTRFTAQVLCPAIEIGSDQAQVLRSGQSDPGNPRSHPGAGRKLFKARIIGPASPHLHIPDPCRLHAAAEPSYTIGLIAMHTTFVLEDENLEVPEVNDMVLVELYPGFGNGRYNLQMGACVGIADSESVNAPSTPYACFSNVSDLFGSGFADRDISTIGNGGATNYPSRKGTGKTSKGPGRNISAAAAALPRPKYGSSETKKVNFSEMAAAFDDACSVSELGGDVNEMKKAKPNPVKYFGEEGWKVYKEALSYFEGSTGSTNKEGYYGQHQFGVAAMVTGGAIKKDKVQAALIKSFKDMNKKGGKYEGYFKDDASLEQRAMWCYSNNSDGTTGQKFCKAQKAGSTDISNIRCCGQHVRNAYADPDVWTDFAKKNNVKSGTEFLQSSDFQHKILIPFAADDLAVLKASGALTNVHNPAVVAGLLAAAHIAGPAAQKGGAADLALNGNDKADGNGTPASYYFKAIAQTMYDKNNGCKKSLASADPGGSTNPST